MRKRKPIEDILAARIERRAANECWPWTGATAGKGYGTIKKWTGSRWKTAYAHREILRLTKGDPANENMHALHSCDNPGCCNPAHLNWGNNSQNRREARDRLHNQGNQKLIPEQVEAIRADTRKYAEIAATYSVHLDTIARIKQGRAWNK